MADMECCCEKHKARSEKENKDLINRLNRIEGQIRGLKNMVENSAYCPDILVQAAAASSALDSFSRLLLESHLRTCVVEDIRAGKEDTIEELIATIKKMM